MCFLFLVPFSHFNGRFPFSSEDVAAQSQSVTTGIVLLTCPPKWYGNVWKVKSQVGGFSLGYCFLFVCLFLLFFFSNEAGLVQHQKRHEVDVANQFFFFTHQFKLDHCLG